MNNEHWTAVGLIAAGVVALMLAFSVSTSNNGGGDSECDPNEEVCVFFNNGGNNGDPYNNVYDAGENW